MIARGNKRSTLYMITDPSNVVVLLKIILMQGNGIIDLVT